MSDLAVPSGLPDTGGLPGRPLRLIHASDLHLDQPPYGMVDIPDDLRDRLMDCPYVSAKRVFEAACVEMVDALILSGDIVDISLAGPRAIIFLQEQFARLAEVNIPVFWVGGSCDPPTAWPPSIPLPENVHLFPIGRVESHELYRGDQPIARMTGTSLGQGNPIPLEQLHCDAGGLSTIGIMYGFLGPNAAERSQVHYLAMGGRHDRHTSTCGSRIVHYPGTAQGRSPAETGRRGCTLVEIDQDGHITLKALATESLRWYTEWIETDAAASIASIEATLTERMQSLVAASGGDDILVTWRLTGSSPALNDLRRRETDQLVSRLREQFGHATPAGWTVELAADRTAAIPASWYEQQTILGDVLRQLQELKQHPGVPVDLAKYLAPTALNGALAAIADLSDPALRNEVLEEAAALAADLLTVPGNG